MERIIEIFSYFQAFTLQAIPMHYFAAYGCGGGDLGIWLQSASSPLDATKSYKLNFQPLLTCLLSDQQSERHRYYISNHIEQKQAKFSDFTNWSQGVFAGIFAKELTACQFSDQIS